MTDPYELDEAERVALRQENTGRRRARRRVIRRRCIDAQRKDRNHR